MVYDILGRAPAVSDKVGYFVRTALNSDPHWCRDKSGQCWTIGLLVFFRLM